LSHIDKLLFISKPSGDLSFPQYGELMNKTTTEYVIGQMGPSRASTTCEMTCK